MTAKGVEETYTQPLPSDSDPLQRLRTCNFVVLTARTPADEHALEHGRAYVVWIRLDVQAGS